MGALARGDAGPDATELIQSGVRTQGEDGPGFEVSSEALAQGLVRAVLSDGGRWAQLLWGNATRGLDPEPVPASGAAQCSAEDQACAQEKLRKVRADMFKNIQRHMPRMMAEGQKAAHRAPAVHVKVNGAGPELAISIGDLVDLPPACTNVFTQGRELHWWEVMGCVKQFFGVSTTCATCVPDFGKHVQERCSMCSQTLADVQNTMDSQEQAMIDKMMKKQKDPQNPTLSPFDTMEVMAGMSKAMSDAAKKVVPCAECIAPKTTTLAKCMMGESAASKAEALGKDVIEKLKSGNMLPMEMIPPLSGGHPRPRHQQPVMPL